MSISKQAIKAMLQRGVTEDLTSPYSMGSALVGGFAGEREFRKDLIANYDRRRREGQFRKKNYLRNELDIESYARENRPYREPISNREQERRIVAGQRLAEYARSNPDIYLKAQHYRRLWREAREAAVWGVPEPLMRLEAEKKAKRREDYVRKRQREGHEFKEGPRRPPRRSGLVRPVERFIGPRYPRAVRAERERAEREGLEPGIPGRRYVRQLQEMLENTHV